MPPAAQLTHLGLGLIPPGGAVDLLSQVFALLANRLNPPPRSRFSWCHCPCLLALALLIVCLLDHAAAGGRSVASRCRPSTFVNAMVPAPLSGPHSMCLPRAVHR